MSKKVIIPKQCYKAIMICPGGRINVNICREKNMWSSCMSLWEYHPELWKGRKEKTDEEIKDNWRKNLEPMLQDIKNGAENSKSPPKK